MTEGGRFVELAQGDPFLRAEAVVLLARLVRLIDHRR